MCANVNPNSETTAGETLAAHRAPARAFTQWHPEDDKFRRHIDYELEGHFHKGFNGRGEKEAFVCRKALEEYWTQKRINKVLDRDADTEANVQAIQTTSLETFSILCYISRSGYFNQFTSYQIIDSVLPITQPFNPRWSGDAGFWDVLAKFAEAQWKFKPLVFNAVIHRKELPLECILPVVFDESPLTTSSNGESVVYKASVYPCCVGPTLESDAGVHDVVFKMLSSSESGLWENEVNAYNFLTRSSPDQARLSKSLTTMAPSATISSAFNYIPRRLGSFKRVIPPLATIYGLRQADSAPQNPMTRDLIDHNYVILLEYARGGNLTTFCERHTHLIVSPARDHRVNLWHQMFHLLRGLSAVHSIDGTHQDIKESNILSMYDDGLLYDRDRVCFKLADFGRSHFRKKEGTGDAARYTNNVGNRVYSELLAKQKSDRGGKSEADMAYRAVAPECCGADEIEQAHPRPYTKAADIWSMGCLFSDMLVRSSLGKEGVHRYRRARVVENQHTVVSKHAPQCFHNGIERLSCVDEFHREALSKYPKDDVLAVVSYIILEHMLQPPEKRKDALTLRAYWINRIIAKDNTTSTAATASTRSLESTTAPSPQPTPAAALHSRTSTDFSRPGPPPPPPSFAQRSTTQSVVAPRPPTPPGSVMSVGTHGAIRTVRQIAEHLRQPQKPWPLRLLSRSKVNPEAAFPDLSPVLNRMEKRNHHILVDSSETMARYREEAAETVWVLSKLLKLRVRRRDSIRLSILAASIKKGQSPRKSSEIADIVRKSAFSGSTGWLLGAWLQETASEIIDSLTKGPSPPVSLYILTDGEFNGEPPKFATPIDILLKSLGQRNIMPIFLSITIIRFGGNPDALQNLRRLQQSVSNITDLPAHLNGQQEKPGSFVLTPKLPSNNPIRICAWDGDVTHMLIGSIRDKTTNFSPGGMTTRRSTDIPNG